MERLSKDFGVPHPTLARTYGREMLNVKPFPFFGGYSSRLFGESWESSNLYWARLADEMGYSPVMLNRLVPELTRHMTAKIFATDLEDWPAMVRAMQETGEELRQGQDRHLAGSDHHCTSSRASRKMQTRHRRIMMKRYFLLFCLLAFPFSGGGAGAAAQDDASRIRVSVVLVQLNVAVTDNKGNYISGLEARRLRHHRRQDPAKRPATFEEGNGPTRRLMEVGPSDGKTLTPVADNGVGSSRTPTSEASKRFAGANVFILFDTSNYMYRGFVFAQDAIADFIRSLEGVSKVALYSYSRDLSKVTALTPDRSQVLRGVRNTVAGDDAALYNGLLMTVKDAAPLTGRKAIVVFSNGPDNASLVPPEDVAELAQSTGTIIYMISTQQAESEPVSTAVFERMSKATGGKAYFSKGWQDEKQAFASIRDDLANLYTISYYPSAEPQPRLALHQREARGQEPAEVPHPDSRRISRASDRTGKPVSA